MGDRVSIRFINKDDIDAPVIFCHWGGISFVEAAVKYSQELIAEGTGSKMEPLDRLEPRTVTCDFLYNIDKYYMVDDRGGRHRISHDIYLGINENDGDNGDNGHFDLDLSDINVLNALMTSIASGYVRGSWE